MSRRIVASPVGLALCVVLVVLSLASCLPSALAAGYVVTDLGTLGGGTSVAHGINASGQVVGESNGRAFLYSVGVLADLGTLGGTHSYAYGINSSGQVVGGSFTTGDASYHAFLYSNGVMTDLYTLTGVLSEAQGINDAGQVAGSGDPPGVWRTHALLYSGGHISDLGTLGGSGSHACGINAAGQVVGYSDITGNPVASGGNPVDHAFLYSGTTMQDIGSLGGTWAVATGINASGQVAGGSYTTGDAAEHAFLYANGTMADIDPLGTLWSAASGINASGWVVGHRGDRAFLYANGAMVDLNGLVADTSWTLSAANAINDAGQIVGAGTINRQTHAFLLTPPPHGVASLVVTNTWDSGPGSLRAAITAANAIGGGSITFAPYLAGGWISPWSKLPSLTAGNTSINGDINGDGKPDIMLSGGDSISGAITITSANNTVSGLAMGGFYGSVVEVSGTSATGNTVRGCHVNADQYPDPNSFVSAGVAVDRGAANTLIDGNTITDCVGVGIICFTADGAAPCANTTIAHNTIVDDGVGVALSSGTAALTGNTVTGENDDGGAIRASGCVVTITDNTVSDVSGPAVFLEAGAQCESITGNSVEAAYPGILAMGNGTAVGSIANNALGNTWYSGIEVEAGAQVSSVSGNTVTNAGGNGIHVEDGAQCDSITGNEISNCSEDGVLVQDDGVVVGSIAGNTVTNVGGSGILLEAGAQCDSITGNTIAGGTDGIEVAGGSTATITGNTVSDAAVHGILVHTGSAAAVSGNTISRAGVEGIVAFGTGTSVTITDNTLTTCNAGIHVGVGAVADTIARNAVIGTTGWLGIACCGATTHDITDNTVDGVATGTGVIVKPTAAACLYPVTCDSITGNTIRDCSGTAISVENVSVRVAGNTLSALGQYGVHASACTGGEITGNTISTTGGNAIYCQGGTLGSIANNTIRDAWCGVIVHDGASVAEIANNTVAAPPCWGIWVGNWAYAGTVSGNTITDAGRGGIGCQGATADSLAGNTVSGAHEYAIWVFAGYGRSPECGRITGNRISNVTADAIHCESVPNLTSVADNTVNSVQGTGISLSLGTQCESITGNIVSTTSGAGIDLNDLTGSSVTGNQVTNVGGHGIQAGGATNLTRISDNVVTNAGQLDRPDEGVRSYGIVLWGPHADAITGNEVQGGTHGIGATGYGSTVGTLGLNAISGCSLDGIVVACGVHVTAVPGNTVSDVGAVGILCCSGEVDTISGNHIARTGWAGIHGRHGPFGYSPDVAVGSVAGNDITDAGGDGIYMNGIALTIEDNTITGGGAEGICVENSPAADIRNNTVSDVALHGIHATNGCVFTAEGNRVHRAGNVGIWCQGSTSVSPASGGLGGIVNNTVSNCSNSAIACCGGGRADIERNHISGGQWMGIAIEGASQGNVVSNDISNCVGDGVIGCGGATGLVAGNTIHDNLGGGVVLCHAGTSITISQNSIYDNGGLGIDLTDFTAHPGTWTGDGVTPNGYSALGPNHLIPFPAVTKCGFSGGSPVVYGVAPPNCTIEAFTAAPDPSGYGEGKTYLESVTSDADGHFILPLSISQWPITMTATDAGGNTSEFSALAMPPGILSLDPDHTRALGPAFTLTVNGINLTPTSTVYWNGSARVTSFVSSTQLTARIPAADIPAPDLAYVTVKDSTGISDPLVFTVTNPIPTITSVSPSRAPFRSPAFTLTVLGSGFIPESQVYWNGTSRATTCISDGQLAASISAADVASVGTATVVVYNPPPDGGTSNSATFTIEAAHSLSPTALTYTGDTTNIYGEPVSLAARLTSAKSPVPGVGVAFSVYDAATKTKSAAYSGNGTTDVDGTARLSVPAGLLGGGTYTVHGTSERTTVYASAQCQATLTVSSAATPLATVASASTNSGAYVPGTWTNQPVTVVLAATGGWGGVASTHYTIDGGTRRLYSGPFTVSSEGQHAVVFWSVDHAGNVEPKQSLLVRIDTTAPLSNLAKVVSGSAATITLSAKDVVSHGAASGVAHTYYTVDGGAQATYQGPFMVIGKGKHAVAYWSVDLAGNVERTRTLTLQL